MVTIGGTGECESTLMRSVQLGCAVIVLLGSLGCQRNPVVLRAPSADSAAIQSALLEMAAASGRGDWASWADWFTEDAIVMVPNRPVIQGRSSIRAFVQGWPPITGGGVELLELEVCAGLAFVRGRYRLSMAMPDGRVVNDSGKTVEIWRRQSDGRWLVARDISSSDLPR
jgi:ketosteroid isomerase-like protein